MSTERRRRIASAALRAQPWVSASVTFAVSLAVIYGWWRPSITLIKLRPEWSGMALATAGCLALLATSLALLAWDSQRNAPLFSQRGLPRRISEGLAALCLAAGLSRIICLYLDTHVLDALGFALPFPGDTAGFATMAVPTAICLVLLGLALLALPRVRYAFFAQLCAFAAIGIAWIGAYRYLYVAASAPLYRGMALHTSILLVLLGAGALSLPSERGLAAILRQTGAAGTIARELLPAALIVPLAIGWLTYHFAHIAEFNAGMAFALFSWLGVMLFTMFVWRAATRAGEVELKQQQAQLALAASQERTRLILEHALDAVILIDERSVITGWSGCAYEVFGWRAEEVLGKPLAETIIPPRLREDHHRGMQRYLASGVARMLGARTEVVAQHRSGHEFPVELAVARVDSPTGSGFSAFVRDISERRKVEEERNERETRFRLLADSTPALVWLTNEKREAVWFNQRWLQFVGRSLEEEIGYGWRAHMFPDDVAADGPMVDAAIAARQPFRGEFRLRRHDGVWRWVQSEAAPCYDPSGRFAGYIGTAVDMTERREAAHLVAESERRFRSLVETLPQLVWTCDANGACDYLSRQWLEYTGRPQEEQLGSGWVAQIHPQDRDRVGKTWLASAASGRTYDDEFRIRRADGQYRWFKTRAVPLRDEHGKVVKWFGSNTDFEELKRAQTHLHEQVTRLTLLDQTTRAIAERQDLNSIYQVVLRSLESHLTIDMGCVLQYSPTQKTAIVEQCWAASPQLLAALHPDDERRLEIDDLLARCFSGQVIYLADTQLSASPLATRLAQQGLRSVVLTPLGTSQKTLGALIVARRASEGFSSPDCEFLRQLSGHVALAAQQAQLYSALQEAYSELRQTQQSLMQQERLRAFGEMASGVAHDINNALSPASLSVSMLLEQNSALPPEAREVLKTTAQSMRSVTQTIARMREFHRRREGEAPMDLIDVNAVLEQTLALTRARWKDIPEERGIVIRVETDLPPGLPRIRGSESELRDACTNIVMNALDAMPAGGVLRVSSSATPRSIAIVIADTGVGMDDITRRRCIEPFFTTKGDQGTGLGLATVYGMAERCGAELQIDSAPGQGTRMRLLFPVPETVEEKPAAAPVAAAPPPGLRVLLVDDDVAVLRVMTAALKRDGHEVTAVDRGNLVVPTLTSARASGAPFDVIITDLGMPEMDGRRVAAAVKACDPKLPVILLTGWGQSMAAPADVDRVLSKPPDLEQLRATLAELVWRGAA